MKLPREKTEICTCLPGATDLANPVLSVPSKDSNWTIIHSAGTVESKYLVPRKLLKPWTMPKFAPPAVATIGPTSTVLPPTRAVIAESVPESVYLNRLRLPEVNNLVSNLEELKFVSTTGELNLVPEN